MALRILSSTFGALRSGLATHSARIATSFISISAKSQSDNTIPSDMEQATGKERAELLAIARGEEDPWGDHPVSPEIPGTKDKPKIVYSMLGERIVGCVCHPDANSVTWMVLRTGPSQRCDCGHYFQLAEGRSDNFIPSDLVSNVPQDPANSDAHH